MHMNRFTPKHAFAIVTALMISISCATLLFVLLLKSTTFERALFGFIPASSRQEVFERELVSSQIRKFFFYDKLVSPTIFAERERVHLADVKGLFRSVEIIAAGFMLGTIFLLSVIRKQKGQIGSALRTAGMLGLSLLVLGGGGLILFFEQAFFTFHTLVFRNDFWQLDPAVHILIRAYPEQFFYLFFAAYLCILAALYGLLCFFGQRRSVA